MVDRHSFHVAPESYGRWREEVGSAVLGLEVGSESPGDVASRFDVVASGDSWVVDVVNRRSTLHAARSRARLATEHGPRGWFLGLGLKGNADITHGGRSVSYPRSALHLMRSDEPHQSRIGARSHIGITFVSDALVTSTLGAPLDLPPLIALPPAGVGAILKSCAVSLFEELEAIDKDGLERTLGAVVLLIAAATRTSEDGAAAARAPIREVQRQRVLRFVDKNLADPALRASLVAERLRISPRYLHALFEESGRSIGTRILAARLERCHATLRDARSAHRSIAEIALEAGFSDVSYFTRAFRRRFGMTPRDLRARANR